MKQVYLNHLHLALMVQIPISKKENAIINLESITLKKTKKQKMPAKSVLALR